MSKSTGKVKVRSKNGYRLFMQKWGIRPGFLYREMLKMGNPAHKNIFLSDRHFKKEQFLVKLKLLFNV